MRHARPAPISWARRVYSARSAADRFPACDAARAPVKSTLTTLILLSSIFTSRNGKKRLSRLRRSHSRPGKQLPTPDSSRVETGLPATILGVLLRRNAAILRGISFTLGVLLMRTTPRRERGVRRNIPDARRSDRNRRGDRIRASLG